MSNPIKIGLIGLGRAGNGMHRNELRSRQDKFTFYAVCDEIPERMDAFAEEFGSKKYGTIEEVNQQWNLNIFSQAYADFDEIQIPTRSWQNPHIRMEWNRFHYQSDMDFIHSHADILRQLTKAPIGTDMMPLNGMGYQDMTKPLDVIQFNHYNTEQNLPQLPLWFDFFRSFGKQQ